MLDPNRRSTLTDVLTPPPGMVFDAGVATTFSLDPLTVLTVPVHLAWLASGEDRELFADGVRLLESLRRVSERLTVFADRGRMLVPGTENPLFALLERTIVEVRAPGGGAFHPKLWVLRFVTPDAPDARPLVRLAVLSRNLTQDRCWDLALTVEGRPTGAFVAANRALGEWLATLPGSALVPMDAERAGSVNALAQDLRRTAWDLPEGWEELKLHVLGLTHKPWTPVASDEMAVISPFVRDAALRALCATTRTPLALISRPEELAALAPETRARFARCLILDENAETEDGEETPKRDSVGLHAKAFLVRAGWYVHLYVGSANASDAALLRGNNVEVLAELVGRRSRVGPVESLLEPTDLMGVLTDYVMGEAPSAPSEEEIRAEAALDLAHRALVAAALRIRCAAADSDAWTLTLAPVPPLPPVEGTVWPLSVKEAAAVPLIGESPLGTFATADVTGLVAFRLTSAGRARAFALNVPVDGLPPDRDAAVLRRVIRNREGFLRYLRLLLGHFAGDEGGAGDGAGAGSWWVATGGGGDALLEDLVRAFARDRSRLADVRRLVDRVRREDGDEIVPADFLALWDVFVAALEGGA